MKKENVLIIILICIGLTSVMVYNKIQNRSSSQSSQGYLIDWQPFDKGFKLAKNENKPIFLYFYADWCSFCKKLKKTTFLEQDVLDLLGASFISIKVDTDVDRELAVQWKVNGLPTSFFLKPDGTKLTAIPGFMDKEKFLNILTQVQTTSAINN